MTEQTTGQRVLAISNLKKTNGVWRGPSPLRPGSDSAGFVLRIDDDGEHGAWTDHAVAESGSLYDLARKLGISTPERAQAENTKRGYASLVEYAAAHGVPVEAFSEAGWREEQHESRPALKWGTQTGTRVRFIDGGKGSPFKAEKSGYKACWYGLKRALTMAREKNLPLVICNGEPSVVVAQHYGIPAAAQTGGEGHLSAMLPALIEAWRGDIVLALDCDDTGRKSADSAALAIGERASIVDLGLTNKGDLADFCKLHTDGALTSLYALPRRVKFAQAIEAAPVDATPASNRDDVRALMKALNDVRGAYRDSSTAIAPLLETVITEAERMLLEVATPPAVTVNQMFDTYMDDLYDRMENPNPIRGLTSGLTVLDNAFGGFQPEVYVLYGATNMGKSTLAVSICAGFLRGTGDEPRPSGLIVPTESPLRRWLDKLIACMTNIPSDCIEDGRVTPAQSQSIAAAIRAIRIADMGSVDSPSPTPRMIKQAMQERVDAGKPYQFVIVDSASKMASPGEIYQRTKLVSDGLQDIYRTFNVPVIVTSQIGRDVADRPRGQKIPRLEDGYGGGAIEHNGGIVMAIYNHDYYVSRDLEDPDEMAYPPGTVLARVLKSRWKAVENPNLRLGYRAGVGMFNVKSQTVSFR